ncbi:MAG: putative toxin-antitoxin system toxin component, PIN family [bacterium]
MKKIVLDTNTIISALFWRGNPRKILDLVKAGYYTLLSSAEIERELIRVLGYPKFGLTPQEILPIIIDYSTYAKKMKVTSTISIIKKDPTDNIFLACAIDGKADYIVSGDHHLLELQTFRKIPIVTPKNFLILENKV